MNEFVDRIGVRPSLAVLAVAGPIHNGEVKLTNRSWQLNASDLKQSCRIDEVCLMNDFTAAAFSVTRIGDDSYIDLKKATRWIIHRYWWLARAPVSSSCLLVPDDGKYGRLWPARAGIACLCRAINSIAPFWIFSRAITMRFRWSAFAAAAICRNWRLPLPKYMMCRTRSFATRNYRKRRSR